MSADSLLYIRIIDKPKLSLILEYNYLFCYKATVQLETDRKPSQLKNDGTNVLVAYGILDECGPKSLCKIFQVLDGLSLSGCYQRPIDNLKFLVYFHLRRQYSIQYVHSFSMFFVFLHPLLEDMWYQKYD